MAEVMNRYGRVGEIFSALIEVAPTDEIRDTIVEFAHGVFQDQLEEEATTLEAEVVRALISCLDESDNDRVPTKSIVEKINKNRDERDRIRPQRVGWVLARLGFRKGRMPDANGSRAVIIDYDLISRLAFSYDIEGVEIPNLSVTPIGCSDAQTLRTKGALPCVISDSLTVLTDKGRHKEQASGTIDEEQGSGYDRALSTLRLMKGPMSWDCAVSRVMTLTKDRAAAEAYVKRFRDDGRLGRDPEGYWRLIR